MGSTSIVSGLNWPMAGQGGLYKTNVISMRVAGWLSFVVAILMFVIAVVALIVGIAGGALIADAVANYEGCNADCQEFAEDAGIIFGIVMFLVFAFVGAISMIMAKLQSVAARKMAICAEDAAGWSIALGVVNAVFAVFDIIGGNVFGFIVSLYFAVVFIVFPMLDDVKSQLTVSKQDAHAMVRGVSA